MKITQVETPANPVNVYLDARREWNERYGSYIAREGTWRLVALMSLIIGTVSVGGVVYLGSQNRLVPYVVEVDTLGSAVAVRRADVATMPNERIIRAQLARWVSNVRSVYVDASAERQVLKEAYGMINRKGQAYTALNDYFRKNDPFQRATTESAGVEVRSVLPVSAQTWRVEWREIRRSRNGEVAADESWEAMISVTSVPPQDEGTILVNPMGIYINDFSWSKRM